MQSQAKAIYIIIKITIDIKTIFIFIIKKKEPPRGRQNPPPPARLEAGAVLG
jgi:hypothetical protein